jgi:hypothetical protein
MRLELVLDGGRLGLGDGLAAAVGLLEHLGAEVDRDLDAVVPVALHRVRLALGEHAEAEQEDRDHRDQHDGDRHGEVAAQAGRTSPRAGIAAARLTPPRWGSSGVAASSRTIDTVLELDNPAAQVVDDVGVVGGHDDRRAGAVDPVEQADDVEADGLVEVAGRLVAEQDLRAVDHGAGDRDPLLLTTGELVGQALRLAGEADHLQGLGDQLADDVARLADHLQGVGDVLVDRLARQEPEVLEDRTHLAAQPRHLPHRHRLQVVAGDQDGAAGGGLLAQRQPQQGGLARAGGADDEDELAAVDVDAHVIEGCPRGFGVDLGDLLEADHPVSLGRRGDGSGQAWGASPAHPMPSTVTSAVTSAGSVMPKTAAVSRTTSTARWVSAALR